jgi:mono/diheme cytochrome c family protein
VKALIKPLLIMLTAVTLIVMISVGTGLSAQKGSESKGRYYFRQNCKQCHTKGATGGEITPLNKTQAQWRTYFASGKHAHNREVLTKYMPDDQLRDVSAFLDAHASDSLQPETCGK